MPEVCSGCLQPALGTMRIGLAEHRSLWLLPFFFVHSKNAGDYEIEVPCCAKCSLRRLLIVGGIALLPWIATVAAVVAWKFTDYDFFPWIGFGVFVGVLVSPNAWVRIRAILQPAQLLGRSLENDTAWVDFRNGSFARLLHDSNSERVTLGAQADAVPARRPVRRR